MKRRFPLLGVVCILLGAGGLFWLSGMHSQPWGVPEWPMVPWGGGGMFGGPGMQWRGPGMMGGWVTGWSGKEKFSSNGEQIYYTGVSARTGPIPVAGGPMWTRMGPAGCVACHGIHGRGGIPIMMGSLLPADIRYEALTKGEHGQGKVQDHPPYTDPLIQRAVTQGIDPGGKPLDWTMPRWRMTDADFADLLEYLKALR